MQRWFEFMEGMDVERITAWVYVNKVNRGRRMKSEMKRLNKGVCG